MHEKLFCYLLVVVVSHHPPETRPLWLATRAACTHAAKLQHMPPGSCLRTRGPLPHPSLNDGE
jgi:hypothetical protein